MNHRLLLLAVLAVLPACSLDRPYPDKSQYAFSSIWVEDSGPTMPLAIRVQRAHVSAPFSSRAIQYRVGENTFEPNYYHAWADDPGELFTASMIRGLRDSGAFDAVLDAGTSARETVSLELFVEALYADVTDAARPIGVVRVIATGVGGDGSLMFSRSYTGDTLAASREARDIVAAFNAGLSSIAAEIIADVRQSGP